MASQTSNRLVWRTCGRLVLHLLKLPAYIFVGLIGSVILWAEGCRE